MFTPYRVRRTDAILLALLLWGLATGLAVEKVVADGVTSFVLLASIPILTAVVGILLHEVVENVMRSKLLPAAISAALAILALSVTLPASIGSSGAARDTAIAKAQAANRAIETDKAELARVTQRLEWAQDDAAKECASGVGPQCKGKRSTVAALVAYKDTLAQRLAAAPPEQPALSGESRIAWAANLMGAKITPDQITMVQPMLLPLILELACAWFLFLGLDRRPVPMVEDEGTAKDAPARQTRLDEAVVLISQATQEAGRPLGVREASRVTGLPLTTVHRAMRQSA